MLFVFVLPPAAAQTPTPGEPPERARWQLNGCARYVPRNVFRPRADRVMRSPTKLTRARGRPLHRMIRCAKTDRSARLMRVHFAKLRRWRRAHAAELEARREIRALPFGPCHGGRWAVPCSIIGCESGGSWTAENSIHARGPYQFFGWPVPWPVRGILDQLAHHRMAAKLRADGLRTHWGECM